LNTNRREDKTARERMGRVVKIQKRIEDKKKLYYLSYLIAHAQKLM
jgi:hypothetical protein